MGQSVVLQKQCEVSLGAVYWQLLSWPLMSRPSPKHFSPIENVRLSQEFKNDKATRKIIGRNFHFTKFGLLGESTLMIRPLIQEISPIYIPISGYC